MENMKKLGFGLMRLPMNGEEIDEAQTFQMVDWFLEKGFTYFDTAYVYIGGNSEKIVKKALVERHPRESFQLATKMPIWCVERPEDLERIYQEQLERTGAGYFDFYLLHSLSKDKLEKLDQMGAWEFARKKKAEGSAKHIGFSFHDTADVLEEILRKHPEADFVQLQINYADWENEGVQSRKCYEVAQKYHKPA